METQAAILERMIRPETNGLTPSVAQYFLAFDFAEYDHQRMNQLVEKESCGHLSDDEEVELDHYIALGHLLALLQAKAQLSLATAGADGQSQPALKTQTRDAN